jgi:uncharacterized protein (DUF362 family)
MKLTRRRFLEVAAIAGTGIIIGAYMYPFTGPREDDETVDNGDSDMNGPSDVESDVYIIKASDRQEGLESILGEFDLTKYSGKSVALKANYNDDHPFPASTHVDTLRGIVGALKGVGVAGLTLAERSGMGVARAVMEDRGVYGLAEELGFEVVSLDEVGAEDWVKVDAEGLHWDDGFYISKAFLEADYVVQTCCLKTHRFGGHFTMSLKNSVGLVAKTVPGVDHNYMNELHGSSHQRRMIAEINALYDVDLVVMDAMKAFVTGGPEAGDTVEPGLFLASRDRVALDAVGVAILRRYGSTDEVMGGSIFELDQIKRAAELGVGVSSADVISLIPVNDEAQGIVGELEEILKN